MKSSSATDGALDMPTIEPVTEPAEVIEPAEAGTYGTIPSGFRLPQDIQLGPVRLQVADLSRSLDFYQRVLGLHLLAREEGSAKPRIAKLGTPTGELVELIERPGAKPAPGRGRTGLFHFALLLPDRESLGRFARHLMGMGVPAGSADHFVSEAFYIQDPDNLGIEVYADRPRSSWRRNGRELVITTERIDMAGLLKASGDEPWAGIPSGTTMGHVHLHVGELDLSSTFYSEALGFDRMAQGYPGALFMGAGGYHHHFAANTWAGRGAKPPTMDESQLLEWTILFSDRPSMLAAAESLEERGFAFEPGEGSGEATVLARDPWGTAVRLEVGAAAAI